MIKYLKFPKMYCINRLSRIIVTLVSGEYNIFVIFSKIDYSNLKKKKNANFKTKNQCLPTPMSFKIVCELI